MIITLLWTALIFRFSSQEGVASSDVSGSLLDRILELGIPMSEFLLRKSAHVFIYFVLGVSSTAYGVSLLWNMEKWRYKIGMAIGIGYSFLCACLDECNQFHTVGRDGKFLDVGVDAIGFVLGSILIVLCIYYRSKHIIKCVEKPHTPPASVSTS